MMTAIKIVGVTTVLALFPVFGLVSPVFANPLNQWSTSCGVDKGSIIRKSRTWTFKTSSNHCKGGVFNQRAEISTDIVAPNHKGAYVFTSRISMLTGNNQQFTIFQIHDGRDGCAPPFSMDVLPSGQMYIKSDIKTGPGESCIRGQIGNVSAAKFHRDGTEQDLKVMIVFDGTGGFDAYVWLNEALQIRGRYDPSRLSNAALSSHFYFKHGIYSQYRFDYIMQSKDMNVQKVRLK